MTAADTGKRSETLDYVQSMLGQLHTMVQAERCDMAAYLIEMAYVEVTDIMRGERPARVKEEKPGDPGGFRGLRKGRAS